MPRPKKIQSIEPLEAIAVLADPACYFMLGNAGVQYASHWPCANREGCVRAVSRYLNEGETATVVIDGPLGYSHCVVRLGESPITLRRAAMVVLLTGPHEYCLKALETVRQHCLNSYSTSIEFFGRHTPDPRYFGALPVEISEEHGGDSIPYYEIRVTSEPLV